MALSFERFTRALATVVFTLSLAGIVLPACASADYRLALVSTGQGNGDITAAGMQCVFGSTDYCESWFPAGTSVTLTATPAPGSVFAGWSGDCSGAAGQQCTLTMDNHKSVLARFDPAVPPVLLADNAGVDVSISALGETVWSQMDPATGKLQVFSSTRGQLTSDPWSHDRPAINSFGDVVWIANGDAGTQYSVQGIIAGAPVKLSASPDAIDKVDINDRREVIWTQHDSFGSHIFSSQRGLLTSANMNSYGQSINKQGDLVFLENDYQLHSTPLLYKLSAGSTQPVVLGQTVRYPYDASINDNGEVVWSEADRNGTHRIVSSQRGVLLTSYTTPLRGVDINNCGDLVYIALDSGSLTYSAFRMGNNSPCATVTGTHGSIDQAAPIAFGDIFTALADNETSPVGWYRFDAAAGDTIHINVNYDSRAPNAIEVGLYDGEGNLLTVPNADAPLTIQFPASYSGSYLLKVAAQAGRFGYSVSLSRYSSNCGPYPCREALFQGYLGTASINALGEYVWSGYDSDTVTDQIYSSRRGKLTADMNNHEYPSINDLGDVVWLKDDFESYYRYKIDGIIDGKQVTVAAGVNFMLEPAINNRREVVWSETDDAGIYQIKSNLRGQLTTSATDCRQARIDNSGTILFVTTVPTRFGNQTQVMKLAAGSPTPVPVTDDLLFRISPVLSDSGEMMWVEKDPITMVGTLKSTTRGVLVPSADLVQHADMNSCGDVIFTAIAADAITTLFRLGESAPCVSFPGAHESRDNAATVTLGDVFTGAADATGTATWYRFEAGAGDTLRIEVNYDAGAGNRLEIGLYDAQGNLVSGPTGSTPLAIVTAAPYGGSYFLKVTGAGGKVGYTVNLSNKEFVLTPVMPEYPIAMDPYGLPSINSLGEVLYTKMDNSGAYQIFSKLRGQLSFDPVTHMSPIQNDIGDLAWVEQVCSSGPCTHTVKAVLGGQPLTLATWQGWMQVTLGISNDGEVVWSQDDAYPYRRVYSSKRGPLTAASDDCGDPDINNHGDVVYAKYDAGWNSTIYLLRAGSSTPEVVTRGLNGRARLPRINDNGEIIWLEDGLMYSNLRGQLPLQSSYSIYGGDINNCGDIVYQGTIGYQWAMLYRYGNSAPCVTTPGAHGTMEQAAPVSYGDVNVALADSAAPVSWYRLEGTAGDTIHIRVNYDNTTPNVVVLGIYDAAGNLVAGPTGAIDRQLDYTVPASGVYFVKVEGQGGRFGFAISAQRTAAPMLKLVVDGQPDGYFATLADLFAQESGNSDMKLFCRSGDLGDDVAIDKCGKTVTINGGYDPGFATPSGKTRMTRKLKLTCGKLVVNGLTFR